MKSSHYGLNILGYTRAIMIKTIGGDYSSKSRSKKIILVRLKIESHLYEAGIVSNRKLGRYGE